MSSSKSSSPTNGRIGSKTSFPHSKRKQYTRKSVVGFGGPPPFNNDVNEEEENNAAGNAQGNSR